MVDKRSKEHQLKKPVNFKKALHPLAELSGNVEGQTALLLHTINEGVYGLDSDGKATFVNPAAEKMTGWTTEDLIGKNIHEFHHHSKPDGSHYPKEECPIYASVYEGAIHRRDSEVFWRKDGTSFPVEYSSTPIYENGERVGAVVVFKDITERKQTENALHQALAEVESLKERLQAENIYLQEEIKAEHNFTEIIGSSPALLQLLAQVKQVAPTDASVLIQGETGTGKELIARAIHDLSPRKNRPLVKVNCGAIPAALVESELFGHEKGAFTGALQRRQGRFELANGGTLFLDEVGELPQEVQVKLLRTLQEQEIERVGGSEPISVDVRIITATHRDINDMVAKNEFRMDLYYRLNVFPVQVPALRERVVDIPSLTEFVLNKLSKSLRKQLKGVTPDTMQRLQSYPWPGNIRELFNVLERAAIISESSVIKIEDGLSTTNFAPESEVVGTMVEAERSHIINALNLKGWVIAGKEGAAALLDIPPSTLRSKMQKLGIQR